MRVLLVNPCYVHPLRRYAGGAIRLMPAPPLGLAYIAAALERRGIAATILDMVAHDLRPADVVPVLREQAPDVVGIACNMAFVSSTAAEIAAIIRAAVPAVPIVMGGSHATFTAREILEQHHAVDFVVTREGESTFSELVCRLSTGADLRDLLGIARREPSTGTILVQPDSAPVIELDSLPFPARHLLPMDAYPNGDEGTRGILVATRGCPFSCAYCSTSAFHGRKVRRHGVVRVVDEMQLLVEKYSASFLAFADDTLTVDRGWVLALCREIRARGLRVRWGCDTRVDLVDSELLAAMHGAGCRVIFFGIESTTQKTLDLIGKGFSLAQAKTAIRQVREAGIEAHASFIIGLPNETFETTVCIADFVEETGVDRVLYNILIAYPGCPLFEEPERYGITAFSTDWSRSEQARPMVRTDCMDEHDIRRAYVYLLSHLQELEQRGRARVASTYK